MRKVLGTVLIATLVAAGAWAQQGQSRQPPSPEQMEERARERAREMRERLQLTDQQEQQMRPILMDAGKQTRELRDRYRNEERSRETMQSMRKEMETIQTETRARLEPILTPEQLAEYDAMRDEWRQQRLKGKGGQRPSKK